MDFDYKSLREKFIEEINGATTKEELDVIEKNQYEEKSELIKGATGYKYPKDVPMDKFSNFQKKRRDILEKLNTENELYRKRVQISPPTYRSVHDSQLPPGAFGGKTRKTRRNKKSKKSRKSRKSRKSKKSRKYH